MKTAKEQTATLSIGGMACNGCASTVQEALNSIEDVEQATVDLKNASATVTFNPATVTEDDFKQAINGAGYKYRDTGK